VPLCAYVVGANVPTSKNAPTPKTEFISDLVFIGLSFHACP
jgi:hypothetical protein